MRLLRRKQDNDEFELVTFNTDDLPPYAILSHTWTNDEEVTYDELVAGAGKGKAGYAKIRFCAERAAQDDLKYFWVDTCCIDKMNKAELSRSINSMFHWYRSATRCYVYLSDVSTLQTQRDIDSRDSIESELRRSKWFTRGWALQELLAPASVEFFSCDHRRLGDKMSLGPIINTISNIPQSALEGTPLSQFSIHERMSWIEYRETKLEEDKAYSLLGIFGVQVSPVYGEGGASAFKRLHKEIEKLENCIRDLRLTDPRDDKKRIEATKGGLLDISWLWILGNSSFQQWRKSQQCRLLWIKGDPGKGKTMLLCGIINELNKSGVKSDLLAYFFCQTTDPQLNDATAVLRGLIYLLVDRQPQLILHVRKKYDLAGRTLFEDANAWVALSEIFTNIIQDPNLKMAYLIIDGLDECVANLPQLLDFIAQNSSLSSRVKWIVSSRNDSNIERKLQICDCSARLSLELKENATQVANAVDAYIDHCLLNLPEIQHDRNLKWLVRDKMQSKANGTFLWVSLVVKELGNVMDWEILQVLDEIPVELKDVYRRMLNKISGLQRRYSLLCCQVLAVVIAAYRPLHLQELCAFSDLPVQAQDTLQSITTIVKMCGSFLTIQGDTVYVIHQSVKDFLSGEASAVIFPRGVGDIHHAIFSKSLEVMSRTLRRDMYNLRALGYQIECVEQLEPDPFAASRYSFIYWVDHLNDSTSRTRMADLENKDAVEKFMKKKFLYWLEALSLCRSMSEGVAAVFKLETLFQSIIGDLEFLALLEDARRFIIYHRLAIETYPLQAYSSALLFSPTSSLIKSLFKHEEPMWITIQPEIKGDWSACLQTLEDKGGYVLCVAFSSSSVRLASASTNNTIKIWDVRTGNCLETLRGHSSPARSVAFSHDSTKLVSASSDKTIKIWNAFNGDCLQTLEGHNGIVNSVALSHDSALLASASNDGTVKIWSMRSILCLRTLIGHKSTVNSVIFGQNSIWLASASSDKTVKIWAVSSGECLQTLRGHHGWVNSVAFSHDWSQLASASSDGTLKIWHMSTGACHMTLMGHSGSVRSVASLAVPSRLASASVDRTVKIWDWETGLCLETLTGHSQGVWSVVFSSNSTQLASASIDGLIKIWDIGKSRCFPMTEGYSDMVTRVYVSPNSFRLASTSVSGIVRIWDTRNGKCLRQIFTRTSRYVSFDLTGLNLDIDDYCIAVDDPNSSLRLRAISTVDQSPLPGPRSKGVGISFDRAWITYRFKNLVWLPSEYRPSYWEAHANTLGVGAVSGKVWMCRFGVENVEDFGQR